MGYLIGLILALTVAGLAAVVGFDRKRVFYPTLLIVIASYDALFAVIGASYSAIWKPSGQAEARSIHFGILPSRSAYHEVEKDLLAYALPLAM